MGLLSQCTRIIGALAVVSVACGTPTPTSSETTEGESAAGSTDDVSGEGDPSSTEVEGTEASETSETSETGGGPGWGDACGSGCGSGLDCVEDTCTQPGTVFIPGLTFTMGCELADDSECATPEMPKHLVQLSAFSMHVYEVAVSDYEACVLAGECEEPARTFDSGATFHYGDPDSLSKPVNGVTHDQASVYCAWLGGLLPTEAQWEGAARGGDDERLYPWGDETPTCELAVIAGCDGPKDVDQVGDGFSPFGIAGMAGNLSEWTRDWYADDYYSESPMLDPTGPADGVDRVARGGAWFGLTLTHRVSWKVAAPPDAAVTGAGFRCIFEQ